MRFGDVWPKSFQLLRCWAVLCECYRVFRVYVCVWKEVVADGEVGGCSFLAGLVVCSSNEFGREVLMRPCKSSTFVYSSGES